MKASAAMVYPFTHCDFLNPEHFAYLQTSLISSLGAARNRKRYRVGVSKHWHAQPATSWISYTPIPAVGQLSMDS